MKLFAILYADIVATGVVFNDGSTAVRTRGEEPKTLVFEDLEATRLEFDRPGITFAFTPEV